MSIDRFSRRHFFYGSLLAGAIPNGGFGSTASLPRLGFRSPNEKLNIAFVGAGGRATVNLRGCAHENVVAFADPDDARAGATFDDWKEVPHYKDFRRMLDKHGSSIDAVVVTTPDHFHAYAAIRCMERGKHVYVEKPLSRSVWEVRMMTDMAARYKVATQMGNQGYSSEGSRIASEIIWSGEIGNVTEVHAWTDRPIWPQGMKSLPPEEKPPATLDWDLWLGPAASRPFSSAYLPFNWRGWIDFGAGALGDGACHSMGAANMALRLGAPTSVEVLRAEGKNPYSYPTKSVTLYDFPARGAMPPVNVFWYDGADGLMYHPAGIPENQTIIGGPDSFGEQGAMFTGIRKTAATPASAPAASRSGTAAPNAAGTGGRNPAASFATGNAAIFVGEKGYLTTDGYGANVRLLPLERHQAYQLPAQVLTRSPGHYQDWIRACKGGDPACSNFSVSGPFSEWAILGLVALRFEGKLEWDSAKMRFPNNPAANEFIKPKIRKGWEIV